METADIEMEINRVRNELAFLAGDAAIGGSEHQDEREALRARLCRLLERRSAFLKRERR